jgi:hypothetical protein
MGVTRDIADMIAEAKKLSDMENTQFITDAQWAEWFNHAYLNLRRKLANTFEDYNTTSYDFSTTSGTADYSVPTGFLKLRKVFRVLDSGTSSEREIPLTRMNWNQGSLNRYTTESRMYMLRGSNLRLWPMPQSALDYRMYYVPAPTTLTATSTDVEFEFGFDEFCIWDAVVKAKTAEESDPSVALAERNRLEFEIIGDGQNRDSTEALQVQDVVYNQNQFLDDRLW